MLSTLIDFDCSSPCSLRPLMEIKVLLKANDSVIDKTAVRFAGNMVILFERYKSFAQTRCFVLGMQDFVLCLQFLN